MYDHNIFKLKFKNDLRYIIDIKSLLPGTVFKFLQIGCIEIYTFEIKHRYTDSDFIFVSPQKNLSDAFISSFCGDKVKTNLYRLYLKDYKNKWYAFSKEWNL